MSESQSITTYKSLVDARLSQLSTQLKYNIRLYEGTNISDAAQIVSNFSNSAEFKQFQAEELAKISDDSEKVVAFNYYNEKTTQLMNVEIYEFSILHLFENKIKKLKQNPLRPSNRSRSYDQVVKGDIKIVEIKHNSEYSHRITFHKTEKFLQYQVFDPTGIAQQTHLPNHPSNIERPGELREAIKYAKENLDKIVTVDYKINEDRDVVLKTGKEWVLYFNSVPGFTPTTVMEIGYKKYIFVIKKAEINKNDKVVFYISMKEIHLDNNLDKMKKLKIPKGKHKNVRFDIDYGRSRGCTDLGTCYCPAGSTISTYDPASGHIEMCIYNCPAGTGNVADVCMGDCQDWGGCVRAWFECWSGGTPCHHPQWVYSHGPPSTVLWFDSNGYYCDDGTCYNASEWSENCKDPCCPPGSAC